MRRKLRVDRRWGTGKKHSGGNPWNDIAGYGILKAEVPEEGADR